MIKKLYNPWHITNPGEKEADKQLTASRNCDETMYVMYQMRLSSRFHKTQMAGDCDFVVLNRLGIMILEVKGGIIGYGDLPDGGKGFYRTVRERGREAFANPFTQVDANADAVKKYLLEKGLRNIFVASAVCFPECEFAREGIGDDDLWHRGQKMKLREMILSSMKSQREKFRKKEALKGQTKYIDWMELEEEDMKAISNALEPQFDPAVYRSLLRLNIEESDRRMNEGLAVLRGLNGNRRIVIQGPPGSGKSTYAFDIIRRNCNEEGKTGLYICWNELLCAEMKARISDPAAGLPPERIKAKLYFDLAGELAQLAGDKALAPTHEKVAKGEMRQLVKGIASKLGSSKKHERYDFVVFDEAQDIFDKGIDHMMKALLKVNSPVQNGNWYVFYDDSQDYPEAGDLRPYITTRDTLLSAAASYSLSSSLRVTTGNGISDFIADAASGTVDIQKNYGSDVTFRKWDTPKEATDEISKAVIKEKGLGGTDPSEILVLFASDLLKADSPFCTLLAEEGKFEPLTPENCSLPAEKIRYTTMLKAKGLERETVILVCSSPDEKRTAFQLFIGASRAKAKVCLLTRSKN